MIRKREVYNGRFLREYAEQPSAEVNSAVRYKKGYRTHAKQEIPPPDKARHPATLDEAGHSTGQGFGFPGIGQGFGLAGKNQETPPPTTPRHPKNKIQQEKQEWGNGTKYKRGFRFRNYPPTSQKKEPKGIVKEKRGKY